MSAVRGLVTAGGFALAMLGAALAQPAPKAPAAGTAAPPPAPTAPPAETVLVGPTGKTLKITAATLAGLDREQAVMTNHSQPHTYEGVRLTELLRLVDAPTAARVHAEAVKDYLVVTGGDGFRAVLSLAETDGSVQAHPVILADRMDGAPLTAHDAPYRLVVDGDRKPSRSVYAVTRIEVKVLP
ncbi:molybdopterin-dependent oxidoreductase [Caulobacter sp. KR2-114]|uniref:molybdopterin-dependent oxidoreductase n=1 Tax=Caulobacter sp. KR2-114 TaxID=3400912 RepID=UPI003C01A943